MVETILEQQIADFIEENFLFSEDGSIDVDTSFMEAEILDSTGILQLVMFVEQTFDVSIEAQEITPDNFDSVRRVVDFVRRKRS